MERYEGMDATFEAPPGWENRSVIAFAAPASAGRSPMNVVMTREPLVGGDSLQLHADRQLMALATRPHFEVVESRVRDVGGRPARQVRFVWAAEHGKVEQVVVYVESPDAEAPTAICFTATVGLDVGSSAELQANLDRLLASVRFRQPRTSDVVPAPSRRMATSIPRAPLWEMPDIPMPGQKGARES